MKNQHNYGSDRYCQVNNSISSMKMSLQLQMHSLLGTYVFWESRSFP